MVLGYKFLCIVSAFLILSCTQIERDNPDDENGINYIRPYVSSSSSAGGYTGSYGSMTDNAGKTYRTVQIGSQTWMAENLNYEASGSKCYNNNSANCEKYGRLYNWETALTVCPSGWHLPSDAEWTALENAVGGSSNAGTKLKATSGWSSNGNGTDNYGFSALPGGYGDSDGSFSNVEYYGRWWSSTEGSSDYAYYRIMDYDYSGVYRGYSGKSDLFSVRCLQD